MKKAFTLIELLVVVLIIGILSAIALPQYQKAVAKARTAEVLVNIRAIKNAYNLLILENGARPSGCLKDLGSTELTGGTWDEDGSCNYTTKHFVYFNLSCSALACSGEISPLDYSYTLLIYDDSPKPAAQSHWVDECMTQKTDVGRYICNSIKSQGLKYTDDEY